MNKNKQIRKYLEKQLKIPRTPSEMQQNEQNGQKYFKIARNVKDMTKKLECH